ncbi:hypothetical protein JCM10212_000627 [Sporobolomyces blumeae]
MAATVAQRNASPSGRSRRPLLPPRTSSGLIAQPTLSRLTTRSSSTSRLYGKDRLGSHSPTTPPPGYNPDVTSMSGARDGLDKGCGTVRPPTSRRDSKDGTKARAKGKGKGKAVAFVVGIPSSGEEGDVEGDLPEREEASRAPDGFEGVFANAFEGTPAYPAAHRTELGIEEVIRQQIRQPVRNVDSLDLDSCLPYGISDYTFVLEPSSSNSSRSSLVASASNGADSDGRPSPQEPKPKRTSMGKGKFSEVLLVRKGDVEFALKHTPLHPHHPLIANRLLREPTILAQLLPHPNLVKVYETIRTPGHFYLIEESLRSSITLEALVSSSPSGVLPLPLAWSVLEQLSSVVKSLHEPLRVVHRDIKPENILVRVIPPSPTAPPGTPPTLLLKLLDFGLATHYSASEPKLTTCCGSPAYHSPELWKGLREPSGTVPYWGPELDIWCVGLTLLRCLIPNKYPLGTSHASLQALSDKVVDSLLAISDSPMRSVLAGFLQLNGSKRMKAFDRYCAKLPPRTVSAGDDGERVKREFKSTSFIPTDMTHRLELPLDTAFGMTAGPNLEATAIDAEFVAPDVPLSCESNGMRRTSSPTQEGLANLPQVSPTTATTSTVPITTGLAAIAPASPPPALTPDLAVTPALLPDSLPTTPISPASGTFALRHLAYPPPVEIVLQNPTDEPVRRAVSYIKYSLRCAGILYHVRDDAPASPQPMYPSVDAPMSLPPTPFTGTFNLPPCPDLDDATFCSYLQCVAKLPTSAENPSKASSALIAALRPSLSRAMTTDSASARHGRSSSTPAASAKFGQRKKEQVAAFTFFLSIRKVRMSTRSSPPRTRTASRSGSATPTRRRNSKESRIVITLSDDRALALVRDALAVDHDDVSSPAPPLVPVPTTAGSDRGRKEARSAALSPRLPNSGSRDARARRNSALDRTGSDELNDSPVDGSSKAEGLGMEMGPRRSCDASSSAGGGGEGGGGGLFDLAGFVGRLVGGGSSTYSSGSSAPASRDRTPSSRRRDRSRSRLAS